MKKFALAAMAALLPLSAFAASAADPVQRIIDLAKGRWETTENNNTPDYFDKLDRDFSKTFAKVYREATKYPALDGSDSPFDYDVITSSQDGCPLKDISVESEGPQGDVTVVDARFRMARISVADLYAIMQAGAAPVIIDVRSALARSLEPRWIPGALHVPLQEVAERMKELPRDREIILYCTCPSEASAARVARILMNHGFKRVRPLHGGLDAWVAAGYAVTTP